MGQTPSEANSRSASRDIPHFMEPHSSLQLLSFISYCYHFNFEK
jgi:hypothetical protein